MVFIFPLQRVLQKCRQVQKRNHKLLRRCAWNICYNQKTYRTQVREELGPERPMACGLKIFTFATSTTLNTLPWILAI